MLGFGTTGKAVCEFAIKHELPIYVSEQKQLSQDQQTWLQDHGIRFEQSGHTLAFLSKVDTVVLSPGVPEDLPLLSEARECGITVISEIELALRLVGSCPVIAVTGTNGKSTTVEVIARIFRSLGRRARVAGNIGIPLISIIDEVEESDILVLELSSYQLEQSHNFRPEIGVLLNLSPDHIRRHGDMRSYASAKAKLFAHQEPDDVAILPRALASQFEGGKGRRVFYDEAFERLPAGSESLLPHERFNLRAALAACEALLPDFDIANVPMDVVCEAFRLPYRMEVIGRIGDVRIINDSKSTNAGSTIAALRSIDSPIVLLIGGRSKGAGYETLIDVIAESVIREVILFGEAAEPLSRLFEHHPHILPAPVAVQAMGDAVERGVRVAMPGDVLLLSPACSSFDAFADYAERGKAFAALIQFQPGFKSEQSRT
jgi:UDP-N-acetylmuramoylalanine--D-glutamate ligase